MKTMADDISSSKVSTPLDWATPVTQPGADLESNETTGRVVQLTDEAQIEVKRLVLEEGKPGLRLGIKGGGCSGLSYMLEFTNEEDGDTVVEFDDFKVFLDRKSTIYLSGITLDYQSGLQGRGFIFQNPQASNTCGCGESFSI
jgi:iron-sulfur cluster assembly accessory protein